METIEGRSFDQLFAEGFGEEGVDVSIVANSWTFDSDGTMEAEIAMKFDAKPVSPTDEDTGTWSRIGNSLTQISNDGIALVFKSWMLPNSEVCIGP